MSPQMLGATLIIANPAARSGRGETAAIFVTRFFSSYHSAANSCSVRITEVVGDALQMASVASDYDTVIALGADGDIHEVVNGLMSIPVDMRPRLGVIPVGLSNDIARTLCMTCNDPEKSITELLGGREQSIDLGKVNDIYFAQTLSFGLDAAVAIDTTDHRTGVLRKTGSLPYLASGVRLVTTGLRGWRYEARVDGEKVEGTEVAFAIQNGRTYGGGFRICPQAIPNDGYLDLCFTQGEPTRIQSLALLGLIRFGRHTHLHTIAMRRVRHVDIEFLGDDIPPAQADGARLDARRYSIDVVPQALRVIVPQNCVW